LGKSTIVNIGIISNKNCYSATDEMAVLKVDFDTIIWMQMGLITAGFAPTLVQSLWSSFGEPCAKPAFSA